MPNHEVVTPNSEPRNLEKVHRERNDEKAIALNLAETCVRKENLTHWIAGIQIHQFMRQVKQL